MSARYTLQGFAKAPVPVLFLLNTDEEGDDVAVGVNPADLNEHNLIV